MLKVAGFFTDKAFSKGIYLVEEIFAFALLVTQ